MGDTKDGSWTSKDLAKHLRPICSVCKVRVEPRQAYVALVKVDGRAQFRWSCEHHPITNDEAIAILGSNECALEWLKKNWFYIEQYYAFIKMGVEC